MKLSKFRENNYDNAVVVNDDDDDDDDTDVIKCESTK